MAVESIETVAGIVIPDTALVREATEFIRSAEDDVLFHHSRRVFLFGALHGRRLGLQSDLELLYVGAMFHDLGLTARYGTSTQRFEMDGADAARDFLLEHGVEQIRRRQGLARHCPAHNARGSRHALTPKPLCSQPVSRPTWSASAERNSPRKLSRR